MNYVSRKQVDLNAQEWVKEHYKGLAGEPHLDVFKYGDQSPLPYECTCDWLCAFYQRLVTDGVTKLPMFVDLYNVSEQEVMAIGQLVKYVSPGPGFYTEYTGYIFNFGDMDVFLCGTKHLGDVK